MDVAQLGWVDFDDRTSEQNNLHDEIVGAMPEFRIEGYFSRADPKVLLTDSWSDPRTISALDFAFTGIWQQTGSCVGAGGGNVLFTLAALEVLRLGDPEQITIPFWLLPYGRSRVYAGLRGRGSGSFGSAFAKAAMEDGVLDARQAGLPQFQRNDTSVFWTERQELEWSDGAAIDPSLLGLARKHIVKSAARLRTADEVEASIRNLYPATCAHRNHIASARLHNGAEPCLIGSPTAYGPHQTSILGVWIHPDLGRLFLNMNQWPRTQWYGLRQPNTPTGAVWMNDAAMTEFCRNGEVYGFSQFSGFPAQDKPWSF